MVVAVTGGSGFIGRRLVSRHLCEGNTVRLLSRRRVAELNLPAAQVYNADLTKDVECLLPFVDGVDVVYHCAGEVRDKERMYAVNVEGTRNLIGAAEGRVGRWVQLSSVGAYGQHSSGIVTEETPCTPVGPYEETKTEADRLALEAAERGAFTMAMLRPSTVIGPQMKTEFLFQLISMINKGLFVFIGKPGASANCVHVENVVDGLMLCGQAPVGSRIYNLSDYCTLEAFVAVIADELNKPVPRLRVPETVVRTAAKAVKVLPRVPLAKVDALIEILVNRSTVNRSKYTTERIQKELGYTHKISIEESLREMVGVWRQRQRA